MIEFVLRLALKDVDENAFYLCARSACLALANVADNLFYERCLSPTARRDKNCAYAVRKVGGEALGVFRSVCKIRAFGSLAKDKGILFSHISYFIAANISNNSVSNKLITNNIVTNEVHS